LIDCASSGGPRTFDGATKDICWDDTALPIVQKYERQVILVLPRSGIGR
jgi:hypothetical protein